MHDAEISLPTAPEYDEPSIDRLLAYKSQVDDALAKLTEWSEEHFDIMPETASDDDVRRIRRVLTALRMAMIAARIEGW